jgi:Aminopeptidase P, N-terminal domain
MTLTVSVTGNRTRLTEKMDKGSVAVIHSNDIMPTNADGTLSFRQNNDLYWLTGIRQGRYNSIALSRSP